ncbi:MAG: ImmA/IrrE family metallo-endopeptidase [Clostridiales bacterium]|nr:ImmA/IrrE family metallo-endopeptidase [Clostridiales bacterium]
MDKMELWKKAITIRKKLGEDATSPLDIFPLVYSIEKLTTVFYPMGDRVSGLCVKSAKNNLIAINSSMTLGRQRFSMAHELYHLFFDNDQETTICGMSIGKGNQNEKNADMFASFFLMPPDALSNFIRQIKHDSKQRLIIEDIVAIEQFFGVSRLSLLIRLLADNEITQEELENMRQNVIISARSCGYDDTLYRPSPKDKQYKTFGFLIKQVEQALENGKISSGKYEEILLAAFRSDLVYGDETEGGENVD